MRESYRKIRAEIEVACLLTKEYQRLPETHEKMANMEKNHSESSQELVLHLLIQDFLALGPQINVI